MSDATDPTDAWADACAEDLAAEQARRRERYGPPPGSAAEELRKLADTVTQRIAELAGPLAGSAGSVAAQSAAQSAERAARQFAEGARAVVEPVVERNPQVFQHLSAAGSELLAAYRAAVGAHEQRWTRGDRPETSTVDTAGPADAEAAAAPADATHVAEAAGGGTGEEKRNDGDREADRGRGEDGPPGTERIDLD